MSLYRHGDVLLQRTPKLPARAERMPGHVLVRGELSGHAHRLEDPAAGSLFRVNEECFLEVHTATRLVHEEHGPIALAPGVYRFWQQREYSPREVRSVLD